MQWKTALFSSIIFSLKSFKALSIRLVSKLLGNYQSRVHRWLFFISMSLLLQLSIKQIKCQRNWEDYDYSDCKIIGLSLRIYLLQENPSRRSGCGNQIEIDKCKSATFHRSMVVAHLNGLIFDFHVRCIFISTFFYFVLFFFHFSMGKSDAHRLPGFSPIPSVRLLTLSVIFIFEFNSMLSHYYSYLNYILSLKCVQQHWLGRLNERETHNGRKRMRRKEKQ